MAVKKSLKSSSLKSGNVGLNAVSAWSKLKRKSVFNFCEDYKTFLDSTKTERESIEYIHNLAVKKGYSDLKKVKTIKKGDKLFISNNKNLCLINFNGFDHLNIIGSHVDSPRLDLKPYPLYEDSSVAMMKTHYYGGIKKYHWVNIPLAIHGVYFDKSGKKHSIIYGESDSDPIFVIPDLLPHLARKRQGDLKYADIIKGEELNFAFANIPITNEEKDAIKLNALNILKSKFKLTEDDFRSCELEIVPALKARDSGIDRSMIAAYGQDDSVCAYTSLMAFLDANSSIQKKNKITSIVFFMDKEETGSDGKTGAKSYFFKNVIQRLIDKSNTTLKDYDVFENASMLSADVTAGLNPNFKEVHDLNNVSKLGYGVSVEKYGGGGGKYSTADADAEFMTSLIHLFDKENVPWQTGELGRVDEGGGGTIAKFFSKLGMHVIDIGPCVLGMHSPYELVSKVDVYSSYLAYKSFYEKFKGAYK